MNYRTAIPILLMPLAGALLVAPAPSAHAATAQQDTEYCLILSENHIYNTDGCAAEAAVGREIASDISLPIRTPLQERDYVFANTNNTVSVLDANVMVNAATEVYLGFGPTIT
jgi:hypothetical protein